MWRLIHDAKSYRACDTLQIQQERLINIGLQVEIKADSLLAIRTKQMELADESILILEERLTNQKSINKDQGKKIRKLKLLAILSGVVALIALL